MYVDREDMRSFIVLLFLGALAWQISMPVKAFEQDKSLFRVELPKVKGQSFDPLLKRAMEIELIRLTGTLNILSNPAIKVFTQNPKDWLDTYSYRPVILDGVKVAEKVVFDFSAQRIYRQFQKSNLLIWPREQRPKIFVVAGHYLAGLVTPLTKQNLSYRADVYFEDFARNVALEITVPETNSDWILPKTGLQKRILEEMLEKANAQYLLVINMQQDSPTKKHLSWQLYSSNLIRVAESTIKNKEVLRDYLKKTFYDVLGVLSSNYRQKSQVFGEFSLSISGVDSFKSFNELESFLRSQRSYLRNVTLVKTSQDKILFEVEYRGKLDFVIESLHKNIRLSVMSNDVGANLILAEWE